MLCANAGIAYSVQWTIVESIGSFFPDVKVQGLLAYVLLSAGSIVWALWRAYEPRSVVLKIANTNTTLRISFGDIFNCSGFWAVPVNEYFDSEIGQPVSPKSLHGQVITKVFQNDTNHFDNLIEHSLRGIQAERVERPSGKRLKYPIGTTAHITRNGQEILLFVLAHTNIETLKAHASV